MIFFHSNLYFITKLGSLKKNTNTYYVEKCNISISSMSKSKPRQSFINKFKMKRKIDDIIII